VGCTGSGQETAAHTLGAHSDPDIDLEEASNDLTPSQDEAPWIVQTHRSIHDVRPSFHEPPFTMTSSASPHCRTAWSHCRTAPMAPFRPGSFGARRCCFGLATEAEQTHTHAD
jgi:hypothetical protein